MEEESPLKLDSWWQECAAINQSIQETLVCAIGRFPSPLADFQCQESTVQCAPEAVSVLSFCELDLQQFLSLDVCPPWHWHCLYSVFLKIYCIPLVNSTEWLWCGRRDEWCVISWISFLFVFADKIFLIQIIDITTPQKDMDMMYDLQNAVWHIRQKYIARKIPTRNTDNPT